MRSEKGFTLIETLIGLAVLGIISVVILGSLAMSAKAEMVNNDLSKAESLARSQVEYIQSQPYNTSYNYLPDSSGFSYAMPMVTQISNGLQEITVTVSNAQTSYTLVDYKVER